VDNNPNHDNNSNNNNNNNDSNNNNNNYRSDDFIYENNLNCNTNNIDVNGNPSSFSFGFHDGFNACNGYPVTHSGTDPNACAPPLPSLANNTNDESSFFATNSSHISPINPINAPFTHDGGVFGQASSTPLDLDYLEPHLLDPEPFPGQFASGNGGFPHPNHLQGPQGTQQVRQQPNFHSGYQNSYISTTPSLSSPAYSFYPPHMSNTLRPIRAPQQQAALSAVETLGDDHYLNALATQNFSSPSIPPLNSSRQPSPATLPTPSAPQPTTAGRGMPQTLHQRRRSSQGGPVDLTKEEPEFGGPHFGIDSSIPLSRMPPTTRGQSNAAGAGSMERKRRPSVTTSSNRPTKSRRKASNDDSSLFGDDDLPAFTGDHDIETIDLSNVTSVPSDLVAPKVDNRVKIGKFQCVICMDDTTALTVTHCGM
jgi:hypothetical protein